MHKKVINLTSRDIVPSPAHFFKLFPIGLKLLLSFCFFLLVITAKANSSHQLIQVAGFNIEIKGERGDFSWHWETKKIEDNLEILTLTLHSSQPAVPPPFSLKWSLPSHNIAGFWSVTAGYRKIVSPSWWPSRVKAMLARSAPMFALFGHDNSNRLNVAVSEALKTTLLSCGLKEEDGRIYCQIDFFTEKERWLKNYTVEIRFDRRPLPFFKALQEIPRWWASHPGYQPAWTPDLAKWPMYSTWYSYHQNVSAETLLEEANLARQLGFRAIIVDDGWQTLDSSRGYAFTGDWRPERIPQMKEFVQALHRLDMKILLWYAVPFMGEKAENFERFKGKYLRYWQGQGAYVLDPRYPEVRAYIINIFKQALQEWDLDGFKLDFIARFTADEKTILEASDGRDYASVNEATDRLMTDLIDELRKIKPDIMIEFRQPYVGPLMRKYGNIFRVGDCPNVAVSNRVGIVDLRLLGDSTAIHSDMIMWHYDEPVEVAALQFLNIIFGVPQVSVRLKEIPQEHLEMLKFLTDYWIRHRSILLEGEFEPLFPLANYPLITARKNGHQITAVYTNEVISLGNEPQLNKLDIFNAKLTNRVLLDIQEDQGDWEYLIRDCRGNILERKTINLSRGTHGFTVPPSGIISFGRINGIPKNN
jgi:alpha-galactosidase